MRHWRHTGSHYWRHRRHAGHWHVGLWWGIVVCWVIVPLGLVFGAHGWRRGNHHRIVWILIRGLHFESIGRMMPMRVVTVSGRRRRGVLLRWRLRLHGLLALSWWRHRSGCLLSACLHRICALLYHLLSLWASILEPDFNLKHNKSITLKQHGNPFFSFFFYLRLFCFSHKHPDMIKTWLLKGGNLTLWLHCFDHRPRNVSDFCQPIKNVDWQLLISEASCSRNKLKTGRNFVNRSDLIW